MTDNELDLTAPDDFDWSSLEPEIEMPEGEEGAEGEAAKKRKAAFGQLRTDRKKLFNLAKDQQARIKELEQRMASGQGQTAALSQPESEKTRLATAYRQNLHARAVQALQGQRFPSDDEYRLAYFDTRAAIVADDRLAIREQQQMQKSAPDVVASVLGTFSVLDEDDKSALRKIVDALPLDMKADKDAVQKEVYSYIGQNLGRFGGQEKDEGKPKAKPVGSPVGAATASGLKGGSPGVKINVTPGSGKESKPVSLKDEDRDAMKKSGLSPESGEDVALYVDAKKLAKQKASR